MIRVPELSPIVEIDGTERYRPPMDEVRGLAWNLGGMVSRSSFKIEYLVAVTRGGLTPTDCVSRALGIKDIQTLAVEVYDQKITTGPAGTQDKVQVYRQPQLPEDGEGALFVDDVLDTGVTLGYVRENWPKAAIAAVYSKKSHAETMQAVDFYGKYVGDIWIDFPWEVEAQDREDLRNSGTQIIF